MSQSIGYARVSGEDQLATVHPIRLGRTTAGDALAAIGRALAPARCSLAEKTRKAYLRWPAEFVAWPGLVEFPDAFVDAMGAEAAVKAWQRSLLEAPRKLGPSAVNQALVAVTLMYKQIRITIDVDRVCLPKDRAPKALTHAQERAVRRAAEDRGPRDSAIIALLLGSGARVEECARLDLDDVSVTARTGEVRLLGKGHKVRVVTLVGKAPAMLSAWRQVHPGGSALWVGQRGPMTVNGITKAVVAAGRAAGFPWLGPHTLRHTYATRLRQGGVDVAEIQAAMGHVFIETTSRYFQASADEVRAAIEKALDY